MVIVIGWRIGDSREEGREGEALGREAAEKQAGLPTNITWHHPRETKEG